MNVSESFDCTLDFLVTDSRTSKIVVSARANEGRLSVLHIAVEVPMRIEVIYLTCMTAGNVLSKNAIPAVVNFGIYQRCSVTCVPERNLNYCKNIAL